MPLRLVKFIDSYANLMHTIEWWLYDANWKRISFAARWLNAGLIGLIFFLYSWSFLPLK